jgi:NAD(P)-dependent dehydrogenase (short-subunit alcohol dehydrogenase family)
MSERLLNKVAVVTGGASGIGEGIVRRFCREGARVLLADLDEAKRNRRLPLSAAPNLSALDVTSERELAGTAVTGQGRFRGAGHYGQQRRYRE